MASSVVELNEGESYEEAELEEEAETYLYLRDNTTCKKNQGHKGFIPADSFKAFHLPGPLQANKNWPRFVKLLCDRTVKITRCYTSKARPIGFPHFSYGGSKRRVVGTGFITGIQQEQGDCECAICLDDDGSETDHADSDWWSVRIYTASHVLFNQEEVESAEIELFYDDEFRKHKVKRLHGWRMPGSVSTSDVCVFECVVNAAHLAKQLERQHREFEKLLNKLRSEPLPVGFERLMIIASHPHGKAKHVTIGEWCKTGQKEELTHGKGSAGAVKIFQVYNTSTCPGSSGAQVCDFWRGEQLDQRDVTNLHFGIFAHSAKCSDGTGKSSIWLQEAQ